MQTALCCSNSEFVKFPGIFHGRRCLLGHATVLSNRRRLCCDSSFGLRVDRRVGSARDVDWHLVPTGMGTQFLVANDPSGHDSDRCHGSLGGNYLSADDVGTRSSGNCRAADVSRSLHWKPGSRMAVYQAARLGDYARALDLCRACFHHVSGCAAALAVKERHASQAVLSRPNRRCGKHSRSGILLSSTRTVRDVAQNCPSRFLIPRRQRSSIPGQCEQLLLDPGPIELR